MHGHTHTYTHTHTHTRARAHAHAHTQLHKHTLHTRKLTRTHAYTHSSQHASCEHTHTHFMSSLGTRRTARAPASTKYLSAMSSMPLVVNMTLAPASMIFWMRSLVMSNSRSRICTQIKHTHTITRLKSRFSVPGCVGGACTRRNHTHALTQPTTYRKVGCVLATKLHLMFVLQLMWFA